YAPYRSFRQVYSTFEIVFEKLNRFESCTKIDYGILRENMKKIKVGQSDLEVSPFNFGGNVFGWTLDEKTSFEILDAFVEAGFDFVDTADSYSHWANNGVGGQSETIIGKWMKERGNRDDIILATKVGSRVGTENTNSRRAHILKTADESLKRLQTDYIDLYYTHYDDGKTPVEETLAAYDELIK